MLQYQARKVVFPLRQIGCRRGSRPLCKSFDGYYIHCFQLTCFLEGHKTLIHCFLGDLEAAVSPKRPQIDNNFCQKKIKNSSLLSQNLKSEREKGRDEAKKILILRANKKS